MRTKLNLGQHEVARMIANTLVEAKTARDEGRGDEADALERRVDEQFVLLEKVLSRARYDELHFTAYRIFNDTVSSRAIRERLAEQEGK